MTQCELRMKAASKLGTSFSMVRASCVQPIVTFILECVWSQTIHAKRRYLHSRLVLIKDRSAVQLASGHQVKWAEV